mgnify:CR=1 FL=1
MFKQCFFLGLAAGVLSTTVCMAYAEIYAGLGIADFSEAIPLLMVSAKCFVITMSACFVFYGLNRIFKKDYYAEFVFNLLLAGACVALVFFVFKSNDPEFKNEDAMMMVDYFKAFALPMVFFPALSWVTLKPLFIRQ